MWGRVEGWYVREEKIEGEIDWVVESMESDWGVVGVGERGVEKVWDMGLELEIEGLRKVIEI